MSYFKYKHKQTCILKSFIIIIIINHFWGVFMVSVWKKLNEDILKFFLLFSTVNKSANGFKLHEREYVMTEISFWSE